MIKFELHKDLFRDPKAAKISGVVGLSRQAVLALLERWMQRMFCQFRHCFPDFTEADSFCLHNQTMCLYFVCMVLHVALDSDSF